MAVEYKEKETTLDKLLSEPNAEYTVKDYLSWQFDEMVELIRGKIFRMSPAPTSKHQLVSSAILTDILQHFKKKSCKVFHAPFDVYLPMTNLKSGKPDTVVQPDITVICDRSKISKKGCEGSPDWVVEIISDHTKKKDIQIKYKLYEECGVKKYWLIYPNEEIIEIFTLDNSGVYNRYGAYCNEDIISPVLFPDLKIVVEEVLAPLN